MQELIDKLKDAQRLNAELQSAHVAGSANWHMHETIDDKLHDALARIGD